MALDLFEETMALLAELERQGVPYAVAGASPWRSTASRARRRISTSSFGPKTWTRRSEWRNARGSAVHALPMRFSDGLEVRRSTKVEPPEMLTLDLLLVNENLEAVWASRERVSTARGDVWVVSRAGLIDMKVWAAREQDLADIRRLREPDR
jgi:hypothetical protein